jgi:hypothetical protein
MNHFNAPNQPKINDQKWGRFRVNTDRLLIVDFRLIWRIEMAHVIFKQILTRQS